MIPPWPNFIRLRTTSTPLDPTDPCPIYKPSIDLVYPETKSRPTTARSPGDPPTPSTIQLAIFTTPLHPMHTPKMLPLLSLFEMNLPELSILHQLRPAMTARPNQLIPLI